ncbi:MAG TPA: MBL fold metallo-hydrolase [Candidatus Hydrogenedentes bacterium]|nr:MBL fold metallo-hydrolase [Candidatus Hydrogenedentota bacterium]
MNQNGTLSLTVLGGGGEVGANAYEVSCSGARILLDCGTHPKKEGPETLPALSLLNRPPHACLFTHAHVDHCGAAPMLGKMFPGVKGYASDPTVILMDRMLHNSVSVMEALAKERGISEYPLYDHYDVNFFIRHMTGVAFGRPFFVQAPVPVEVSFHEAGHVLGSAGILIQFPGHTLYYTGDVCRKPQFLLGGARFPRRNIRVDTLIIESTQGGTDEGKHFPFTEETNRLARAVDQVIRRGGCVLIPSFALGRTQEMVNLLAHLRETGRIAPADIYTAGLGRAIYEVYDKFSDHLKPGAWLRPLDMFKRMNNVVAEPGEIRNLLARPCIIVATSGMMLENTPSAVLAAAMTREERHGIFFVGYLDPETPGYKLLHAAQGDPIQFELEKPPVPKGPAEVRSFRFSAHATRSELAEIIDRFNPKNIVYIHGDPDALAWMRANTGNGGVSCVPMIGQTVTLEA